MRLSGNRFQCLVACLKYILLQNRGVSGQVIGRLAVVDVGNGNQTYCFPLLGLIQRAQGGSLFLIIGLQRVQGTKHIEVGHRNPHDQILLLCGKTDRSGLVTGLCALQVIPVSAIDHALIQTHSPVVVVNAGSKAVIVNYPGTNQLSRYWVRHIDVYRIGEATG